MFDRRKQEHSLENVFKRISSSIREMSKNRKIIEKKMKEKEEEKKFSHFTFFIIKRITCR
jgi:hypothetical protein